MDCHHGTYVSPIEVGHDHCDCQTGWRGTDCSLCADNAVCPAGSYCDKTLVIEEQKAFNCTPKPNGLIPSGAITAQWNFTAGDGSGNGVVSVYIHPTGAPFLFNCSFDQCSKNVGDGSTESVTCQKTSCHCSTWCNTMVKTVIKQMKTKATFACQKSSGDCTITQNELPLVIDIQCEAAACQESPYVPPPPKYTHLDIAGIAVGTVILAIIIVGAFVIGCLLFRRRGKKLYQELEQKEIQSTLSWHNIKCIVGDDRLVLNGISGVARPGELMAILGPSGSGKTTFLDILNGRKNTGHVYGEILINGQPRNKGFKRISGYVLQDDRMLGTLTVKEHLIYVALLRLPSLMPYDLKLRRVEQVMEDLGISHIADSLIGTEMSRGISGGERRRLCIASELVTDPSILFLDEPTSGLDSYNAYTLMETLKRLAKHKNRTVVMSIHQPRSNIFQMFDTLLLLSHGEMVYYGSAHEALDHFGALGHECPRNYNPADFLIDLVTMNSVGLIRSLARSYKEGSQAHEVKSELNSIQNEMHDLDAPENLEEYASYWWMQIWVLCRRTLLNNLRNPYLLRTQYVLTFGLGILLGTIYWHVRADITGVQDRAGVLFFLISLLSFGSMSSIDIFFQERVLFLRERANGMYRTSSYFIAKTLCDIVPMRVIPPIILGSIVYYMVGLHPSVDAFGYFLLILVLISLVASAMNLAISAFTPSLSLGNLIAILLLLFYMLFGGFLVNKQSMPAFIQWLKWLSFLNYGFEVLLVNELNNLSIRFSPKGYKIKDAVNLNGRVFLEQFDMDPNRFHFDLWMLGVMSVGYLLITYAFLRWAVKERR